MEKSNQKCLDHKRKNETKRITAIPAILLFLLEKIDLNTAAGVCGSAWEKDIPHCRKALLEAKIEWNRLLSIPNSQKNGQ